MSDRLIIAPELIIYYPDPSKGNFIKNGTLLSGCVTSLDTANKKQRIKSMICRDYKIKPEDLKEIRIKNTKLNFRLIGLYYYNSISVAVKSSELNLEFDPAILISIGNLIEIISKAPIVRNGSILLDCCLNPVDNSINTSCFNAYIEDDTNEDLKLAKEAGLGLKRKKTSKWIPGHMYILSNKKYIIALGDIKNFLYGIWGRKDGIATVYPKQYTIFNGNNFYNLNGTYIMKDAIMYVEVDPTDIDNYKNQSIFSYIVSNIIESDNRRFCIRSCDRSKITGTDLGEVLKVDDPDYITKVKLYCKEKLETTPCDKYWNFYPEYFDNNVEFINKYLSSSIKNFFNKNIYYISKTKEEFKKSYYYSEVVFRVTDQDSLFMKYLSKDELVEIIDSCIPISDESV